MWQDDERAKSVQKDWQDAKEYCRSLSHAGFSDWYLPSISELETLIDTTKEVPAIKDGFKNVSSSGYWSSSSSISDSNDAWVCTLTMALLTAILRLFHLMLGVLEQDKRDTLYLVSRLGLF